MDLKNIDRKNTDLKNMDLKNTGLKNMDLKDNGSVQLGSRPAARAVTSKAALEPGGAFDLARCQETHAKNQMLRKRDARRNGAGRENTRYAIYFLYRGEPLIQLCPASAPPRRPRPLLGSNDWSRASPEVAWPGNCP